MDTKRGEMGQPSQEPQEQEKWFNDPEVHSDADYRARYEELNQKIREIEGDPPTKKIADYSPEELATLKQLHQEAGELEWNDIRRHEQQALERRIGTKPGVKAQLSDGGTVIVTEPMPGIFTIDARPLLGDGPMWVAIPLGGEAIPLGDELSDQHYLGFSEHVKWQDVEFIVEPTVHRAIIEATAPSLEQVIEALKHITINEYHPDDI